MLVMIDHLEYAIGLGRGEKWFGLQNMVVENCTDMGEEVQLRRVRSGLTYEVISDERF